MVILYKYDSFISCNSIHKTWTKIINTHVMCLDLLVSIIYICCRLVAKFFPDSFVTPWIVACQASPPVGFPRQEWSGLLFPFPGYLPDPGIEPASPALAGRLFTHPHIKIYLCSYIAKIYVNSGRKRCYIYKFSPPMLLKPIFITWYFTKKKPGISQAWFISRDYKINNYFFYYTSKSPIKTFVDIFLVS